MEFHPQDVAAHKQLVELLRKKSAFRALVVECAKWIKNNPGDYATLTEIVGYSQIALHDPEFAIAQQKSFFANTSRSDDAWDYDSAQDMLANDLNKRGRSQEALKIFDEIIRLNPLEAGFWADRSVALLSMGRTTDAIESLKHSLDLDSSSEIVHQALAEAFIKSGDLSSAEAEYRAALSVYQAQYKTGQPTDSFTSMIKAMIKIEADNHSESALAMTHLKLARVLWLEKKWESAISETQLALEADRTAFGALYLQAQIYESAGDPQRAKQSRETARAAIEKLAKGSPHSGAVVPLDPRLLFTSEGLFDSESGAMAFPSEAVSILEPRISHLTSLEHIMLFGAYLDLGRIQDAIQQVKEALLSDPKVNNAIANENFGQRLLKAGAVEDAVPYLQRAYELDPQNITYRMDYELAKQAAMQKQSR